MKLKNNISLNSDCVHLAPKEVKTFQTEFTYKLYLFMQSLEKGNLTPPPKKTRLMYRNRQRNIDREMDKRPTDKEREIDRTR